MDFPRFDVDIDKLSEIAREYNIKEMSFFGSVLRADFSEHSDIDVLIEIDPEADCSLFDLFSLKQSLESLFKKPVDLVEKASLRNPYRRQRILESARRVYAA